MRQKGASMYKENVKVSCFISHPDLDNGSETDLLATSIDLIPTLIELAQPNIDWQERWPDLKGVSLTGALSGNSSERDDRGMLLNYTATLAWDIDFVETLFKGQVRGEFTEEEKAQMGAGQSLDGFACYRGIHDGRYKFARYFKPALQMLAGEGSSRIQPLRLKPGSALLQKHAATAPIRPRLPPRRAESDTTYPDLFAKRP